MQRTDDGSGLALLVLAVCVALVLLTAWVLVRMGRTITQAWLAHPRHKALWVPTGIFLAASIAGVLAAVTSPNADANAPIFFVTAGLAFGALYLVSYVLCVADHHRFEKPIQLSDIINPATWLEAA